MRYAHICVLEHERLRTPHLAGLGLRAGPGWAVILRDVSIHLKSPLNTRGTHSMQKLLPACYSSLSLCPALWHHKQCQLRADKETPHSLQQLHFFVFRCLDIEPSSSFFPENKRKRKNKPRPRVLVNQHCPWLWCYDACYLGKNKQTNKHKNIKLLSFNTVSSWH